MSFAPQRVSRNLNVSPFAPHTGVKPQKRRRGIQLVVGNRLTRAMGAMDWDARGQTIEQDVGTHDTDKVF